VLRGFSIAGLLVASLPVAAACDALTLQRSPEVIYLVPENFSGWVCVDFEVKGASPLPREGHAIVIRARPNAILRTSDSDEGVSLAFPVEAFEEVGDTRRRLPMNVRCGGRSDGAVPTSPPLDGAVS
jgi:hypothetical protein